MAEFKATVERLTIEEHTNADALELAVVGDYRAIVVKGHFKTGDLAVYIPEQSIVPDWLIASMGLEGRLAGKAKNRVKAIKLRGQLSQGLIYKAVEKGISHCITAHDADGVPRLQTVREGDDVTDMLGITKWEPPIPTAMNGKCWNASGRTMHYDIENIKRHPDVLVEGETVSFTEKLHGTWCCFGANTGDYIVTSKGMSAKGLAFALDEDNERNLYVRQFLQFGGKELVDAVVHFTGIPDVYILGEIFGQGVQDLGYGMTKPTFRIFDIYLGNPQARGTEHGHYLNPQEVIDLLVDIRVVYDIDPQMVPILWTGPFSKEMMDTYTSGKETVSGRGVNLREGIVMRPMEERDHPDIGRVILKSVSEAYLLRKGNTTEFN